MEVIRRVWTYEPHALERDGVRECRRLVARYAALGTGLGLAGVGVAMGSGICLAWMRFPAPVVTLLSTQVDWLVAGR